MKRSTNLRGIGRLLGTASFILAATLSAAAAEGTPPDRPGFREKMEQWQERMSEKFRDTWRNLRDARPKKPLASASLDLREDRDCYTLRLNLPDRDLSKVEVKLDGGTLRIVAPLGDRVSRYEQTIALAGAAAAAEPKVERRPEDSMIVVSVPKASEAGRSSPILPDPSLFPLTSWDHDILARMEEMRRDMDRAFEEAFRGFRGTPEHRSFFDEPRFGASFDLQDETDRYVIRVYLPDRDMQHIDVTVEGETLKVEAKEQATARRDSPTGAVFHSNRKAAYAQRFTLPGPVQGDRMKVEKKVGMLVVTLPKAK